jgi:hypothetical protein
MKAVVRMDFELNRRCAGTFRTMVGHGLGRLLLALSLGAAGAPGISVLSSSGAYRVAIEAASTDQGSAAPVPTAAIGYDTFTVAVTSVADGGAGSDAGLPPPDGLMMTTPMIGGSGEPADPYMPQHGHGASTVPTVTAQGGGAFSVSAIDFFMGGYWELYLELTPPGGTVDPLTFKICIPDD